MDHQHFRLLFQNCSKCPTFLYLIYVTFQMIKPWCPINIQASLHFEKLLKTNCKLHQDVLNSTFQLCISRDRSRFQLATSFYLGSHFFCNQQTPALSPCQAYLHRFRRVAALADRFGVGVMLGCGGMDRSGTVRQRRVVQHGHHGHAQVHLQPVDDGHSDGTEHGQDVAGRDQRWKRKKNRMERLVLVKYEI